jgi:hypothetical protein
MRAEAVAQLNGTPIAKDGVGELFELPLIRVENPI